MAPPKPSTLDFSKATKAAAVMMVVGRTPMAPNDHGRNRNPVFPTGSSERCGASSSVSLPGGVCCKCFRYTREQATAEREASCKALGTWKGLTENATRFPL